MNVTMKDIAQELGVSIGTVSKVLRNHPDISPGNPRPGSQADEGS